MDRHLCYPGRLPPRFRLTFGLFASAALAFATQPFVLKWIPKVGDKAVYRITLILKNGDADEIALKGLVTEETTEVDGTKVVTRTIGSIGPDHPDDEAAIDATFKPDTTTLRPGGAILDVKEEGEEPRGTPFRTAREIALVLPNAPVSVGDTWTFEETGDEKTGVPGVRLAYTLAGEERIGAWDTYRITMKGLDTGSGGARSEATFWSEKTTGARIRTQYRITNEGTGKNVDASIVRGDLVRQL